VIVVVVGDDGDGDDRSPVDDQAAVGEPVCTSDEQGHMVAEIPVTNPSSERSNYTIEVSFETVDGTPLIPVTATVIDLEPGEEATALAQSFIAPPAGGFTCRVTAVERIPGE
jgi:hypothetical protein